MKRRDDNAKTREIYKTLKELGIDAENNPKEALKLLDETIKRIKNSEANKLKKLKKALKGRKRPLRDVLRMIDEVAESEAASGDLPDTIELSAYFKGTEDNPL